MDAIILYMDKQMVNKYKKNTANTLILYIIPYIHPNLIRYYLNIPDLNGFPILTDNLKKVFYEVEPLMKDNVMTNPDHNFISSLAASIRISNMNVDEFMVSPYFKELLKPRKNYDNFTLRTIVKRNMSKEAILELYNRTQQKEFRYVMLSRTDITIQDMRVLGYEDSEIPDLYNFIVNADLRQVEENMHINWEFIITSLIYNPTFTHEFALRHLPKIIRDTDNFNYSDEILVNEVYILQHTGSYEYLKEHINELNYNSLSLLLLRKPKEQREYINGLFRIICEYSQYSWDWFYISMANCVTIEIVLERQDIPWDYIGLANNTNFNEDIIDAHPELPWKYHKMVGNPNMGWKKFPFNEFNTYTEYRKSMVKKITRKYICNIFELIKTSL
jgi:hypothetical protein